MSLNTETDIKTTKVEPHNDADLNVYEQAHRDRLYSEASENTN